MKPSTTLILAALAQVTTACHMSLNLISSWEESGLRRRTQADLSDVTGIDNPAAMMDSLCYHFYRKYHCQSWFAVEQGQNDMVASVSPQVR